MPKTPHSPSVNIELELNPAPHKYRVYHPFKVIFALFLLVSFVAYFYMIYSRRQAQQNFMNKNSMAAVLWHNAHLSPFSVIDPVLNKPVMLNEGGQWILLNLWATWCPSCIMEMPSLDLLQKKLGPLIKVVALSLDDNKNAVLDFIATNNPQFTVLLDPEKTSQKLFGVDKFPETFLISNKGTIVAQFSGPRSWSSPIAIEYIKKHILNEQ